MIRIINSKIVKKYIGVVGYSEQKFDNEDARQILKEAFDKAEEHFPDKPLACVSGLTDLGIPALAYREAVERGWATVGVACKKAKEHKLFPVDSTIIEGKDWGDESESFLSMLDLLVRVGGGKQSHAEAKKAKEMGLPVLEYDLAIKSD